MSSGSVGNAALLTSDLDSVLIDCGVSLRYAETAFESLGFDPRHLDAILITHAHQDHCKSAAQLALKYGCPIYTHARTFEVLIQKKLGFERLPSHLICLIHQDYFHLGEIKVNAFALPHKGWAKNDDPGTQLGFVFEYHEKKLAYATDLGMLPESLYPVFTHCDAYFLEANHDIHLQRSSQRPMQLIQRNLSNQGHLSNQQTAEILRRCIGEQNSVQVMLSHLSQDCNRPELAYDAVTKNLQATQSRNTQIHIAPALKMSSVLELE